MSVRAINIMLSFFLLLSKVLLGQVNSVEKKENAVIYFKLMINGNLWNETQSSYYFYFKEGKSRADSVRTLDTLNRYIEAELERHFGYDLNPIHAKNENRNMWGTFQGYPNLEKVDAIEIGKYVRFIVIYIKAIENLKGSAISINNFGPIGLGVTSIKTTCKIKEFDSNGKKISRHRNKTINHDYASLGLIYQGASMYKTTRLNGNQLFNVLRDVLENTLNKP